MSLLENLSRRFVVLCTAVGIIAGAFVLSVPLRAQADDDVDKIVQDGLKKIGDNAKCRTRCNQDSLVCISRCPAGAQGAACRATCAIQNSNCEMNCDN